MKNLWVDGDLHAPRGWDWAKTYDEAINLMRKENYYCVSMEHLLSGECEGKSYVRDDLIDWVNQRKTKGLMAPIKLQFHG